MRLYKTYSFRDKDPVIDEARTLVQSVGDAGKSSKHFGKVVRTACLKAGLSPTTADGWFRGKTRRPQSASLEAFGRALGFRRKWVKLS